MMFCSTADHLIDIDVEESCDCKIKWISSQWHSIKEFGTKDDEAEDNKESEQFELIKSLTF